MTFIFLLISIGVFIYSFSYKNEVLKSKDGAFTSSEKWRVLITEFFSPILVGAVYYYGWRKKLPKKASKANKYSWIMFFVTWFVLTLLPSLLRIR